MRSRTPVDVCREQSCSCRLCARRDAHADLRALMDRLAERSELDDEAAMALAVDEVRAERARTSAGAE